MAKPCSLASPARARAVVGSGSGRTRSEPRRHHDVAALTRTVLPRKTVAGVARRGVGHGPAPSRAGTRAETAGVTRGVVIRAAGPSSRHLTPRGDVAAESLRRVVVSLAVGRLGTTVAVAVGTPVARVAGRAVAGRADLAAVHRRNTAELPGGLSTVDQHVRPRWSTVLAGTG